MAQDELLQSVADIARQAGAVIMEVYQSEDFEVELKSDDSPLTKADKLASELIVKKLNTISNYPVISEENTVRSADGPFWLVDPLDGTKEFVKRNGEFTVNIALIEDAKPVLGVVYAPDLDVLYAGDVTQGRAYKRSPENGEQTLPLEPPHDVPVIVTSKSHKDERTQALLDALGKYEERSMGSSLKLCLVAEGIADLYPRIAPTYLWDTAAADAVVSATGGAVKDLDGNRLRYDPAVNMKNPFFVVERKDNSIDWINNL